MYRELISIILQSAGIRKRLFPVPFFAINAGAAIIETIPEFFLHAFPIPPLSRDQIRMLRIDNIVGDGAYGFENLSISPSALESILPTYIKNHKNMRSL